MAYLMLLKTPQDRIGETLTLMAEGCLMEQNVRNNSGSSIA